MALALFTSNIYFFLIEVKDEEEDQCWIYDGKKLSDKAGIWAPIEVTLQGISWQSEQSNLAMLRI